MMKAIPIGKRARQVEHNATHRNHDLSAQFQEAFAQGRNLRPSMASRSQVKAHLLQQYIRGRRQEYPERVGPEVRTTRPADLHAVVQFFNPVFHVAPQTVDLLVNPLRTLPQVRDHEPWVVFGFFVRRSHHLSFINDASLPRPSFAGSISALAVDRLGLTRDPRGSTGPSHCRLGFAFQHRIGGQINDVFHFGFAVQKVQNLRGREAAVEPHPDSRRRKSFLHSLHQSAQYPNRSHRAVRVSRPQHRRDQILVRFLIKAQKAHHRKIAGGVIVMVKEGQLLGAVGGIVGRSMVTRRAWPRRRRRCRSITQSASASLKRNNCLRSRLFSKRDKVGCEARSSPWIGSRPTNSLWTGSEPSRAASLVSGYPHAIAMTRCVRSSLNSCLIFFDCRLSSRALARAVVRPNPRSAARNRIAPPSELPCR